MNNKKMSFLDNFLKFCVILLILFCCSYQCPASPVWPVSEDMIGIPGNGQVEFMDPNFNSVPPVIEYNVGDDWIAFPHKLTNKAHEPHTVHILFETNEQVSARNLILLVASDAPDQLMVVYFDDHHIGKEKIQIGPFCEYTFWLGVIKKGSHRITITNNSPQNPSTAYGILFDFIQLISPDPNTINIPEDYSTIEKGIQGATPGDTIYVKKDTYKENNIVLKSGITLLGEDPNETIIDGEGKTVIIGAYQSWVKGFTIRNGGLTVDEDQGFGVKVFDDFMSISNNIIHSCAIGVSLTGQDLNLVNNTLAQNNWCLYIQRLGANSPLPKLKCKNNIFSDSNYALCVFSDTNSSFGIDPDELNKVIKDFSFNNIFTKFQSNINLSKYGKENIQTDPYFVDTNAGNYHLMSYSECIDAGDPNLDFFQEPEDNGQRINMGAFGNTPWAKRSLDSDGDGVKDYVEGLFCYDNNQIAILRSSIGDEMIHISLDMDSNVSISLTNVRTIDPFDPNISGFDSPSSYILYGFWGFKINGLDYNEKVPIEIHFPQKKLFEFQEYIVFDPDYGWEVISIKEDSLHNIISIELSDGGIGDMDKTINGSISHIGGISATPPFHKGIDSISCFIQSLKGP